MDLKIVCFFALYLNIVNSQGTGKQCKTPTQDSGVCISIKSCQAVMNVLQSISYPIRPEIKAFLGAYKCGSSRGSTKVCCPSKPINIEEAPPLDVSDHKNLHLLPKDCGYLDTSFRIFGGNKTGLFEFPWMALLSYKTLAGPAFLCGGSIINDRYILTAAHCLTNSKYPLLGVRIGEHDISTPIDCEIRGKRDEVCAPPYQDLRIVETIPHPQYNNTTRFNDIGLIRVDRMNLSAGLLEFLLDRNVEKIKECKEAKYSIIELLAASDVFDHLTLKRLEAFVREGPFYVEAVTEVAIEGND